MDKNKRRTLKVLGGTLGAAAFAYALAPLRAVGQGFHPRSVPPEHYKELTPDEMAKILLRTSRRDAKKKYGREVTIDDVRPHGRRRVRLRAQPERSASAAEMRRGLPRENNHDRATNNSYIRVLEMEQGSFDFEKGDANYDHPVPAPDKYYMPVQCQQCDNAAVRDGVPGRGDLEGAGRDRGRRLQLVHRLPLLRGGVPVPRAALQLDEAGDPARGSTRTRPTSRTASARRG